jgi:hypothetical protein
LRNKYATFALAVDLLNVVSGTASGMFSSYALVFVSL